MRSVYVCNVAGPSNPAQVTALRPPAGYGDPVHHQARPDLSRDGPHYLNPVAPALVLASAFAGPVHNGASAILSNGAEAPPPVRVLKPLDVDDWKQK
jgi:hypothetical protein